MVRSGSDAIFEICSVSSKEVAKLRNIAFAGAKVWVVLIHLFLEKRELVELNESKNGGGEKQVEVFETVGESASNGVDTFDHVDAHALGASRQGHVDQEGTNRNDFSD